MLNVYNSVQFLARNALENEKLSFPQLDEGAC